jgi:muramidase (phage lysozyme)
VVAVAIAVFTGVEVRALVMAGKTGQAFALAAAGGAVSGGIQSGTVEGAAWGAFSAGVFFGIGQGLAGAGEWASGSFLGSELSGAGFAVKTVSHGLAGGTISHLQGGKFGHGFVSAAGSAATAPLVDSATAGGVVQGAIVTTLVGGTLSRLSGGNFANGALTAAMSYAFNQIATAPATQRQLERRERAAAFLATQQGAAFLQMIQEMEGHDYNVLYGGATFEDFSRHPGNVGAKMNGVRQSAAGAFAITLATFRDVGVRQLGINDFHPHSQRLIAAHMLLANRTDVHLASGDFWSAVNANSGRWASLASNRPGVWATTRYRYPGQGHHSWSSMRASYERGLISNIGRLSW